MTKVVVFREMTLSETDFTSRIDGYLGQVNEAFRPFEFELQFSWNEHRDHLHIQSRFFSAEVIHLKRKGVVVMANLAMVAYPFKRQLEELIDRGLANILGSEAGA